jgi:hypothetical protein
VRLWGAFAPVRERGDGARVARRSSARLQGGLVTPRRLTIATTLYGKRLVTYDALMQLHREVSRAASIARLRDPEYIARTAAGKASARQA